MGNSREKALAFLALGLGLASVGLISTYFADFGSDHSRVTALDAPRDSAPPQGEELVAPIVRETERFLEGKVDVSFDGRHVDTTWKALGLVVEKEAVRLEAARLKKAGTQPSEVGEAPSPRPVEVDQALGVAALLRLKDAYDRPATDARIDLEHRAVIAEEVGYGISVYDSLPLIERAARRGEGSLELKGGEIRPALTRERLGNLDISSVLATFSTKYPPGERDRNYNLKLVAEKLNGHVLMPGEEFSFNAVVGDRTEKQGYRVAHVIQAGEMVDGLAGGACQISSTLHGASWFAGLDIVYSTPHSRPSAYITMGLDATVVYPTTDLKLRNPYEFPVVIRYVVSQGTVLVEILGKGRPYDKVEFERQVREEIPYETMTREDGHMPVGSSIVEQIGFPGYNLLRRRLFYKDGEVVKTEKWAVRYPPTTEYVRIGTNPNPNLPVPEKPKLHAPMGPGEGVFRLAQ